MARPRSPRRAASYGKGPSGKSALRLQGNGDAPLHSIVLGRWSQLEEARFTRKSPTRKSPARARLSGDSRPNQETVVFRFPIRPGGSRFPPNWESENPPVFLKTGESGIQFPEWRLGLGASTAVGSEYTPPRISCCRRFSSPDARTDAAFDPGCKSAKGSST